MKPSALIVGCGYVGYCLKLLLEREGWSVDGIRRTLSADGGDLAIDVGLTFSLERQYHVVFYMVSAGNFTPPAYQKAYVTGLHHTLLALKASHQNPRFLFVSSSSTFLESNGGLVHEESAIDRSSFAKRALITGEELIAASGLPYSILRLSGIYGPGRCRLIDQLKSGQAFLQKQSMLSNRIHVEDCARALLHLATTENLEPLYIGSDCQPTPYNEILRWLAKQMGLAQVVTESEAAPCRRHSHKRLSNARLIQSGFHFKYPSYREGLLSCL